MKGIKMTMNKKTAKCMNEYIYIYTYIYIYINK